MGEKPQTCLCITLSRQQQRHGNNRMEMCRTLPDVSSIAKKLNIYCDNFSAKDMKPVKDFAAYVQQYIEK